MEIREQDIQEKLNRQRIQHIISSYQLSDQENGFNRYLDELMQDYPQPLVELALVETLIDQWLAPLRRGSEFLAQTHSKLQTWENCPIVSTITPAQFQQIVGLDPTPIFGSAELPPVTPILPPPLALATSHRPLWQQPGCHRPKSGVAAAFGRLTERLRRLCRYHRAIAQRL